MILVTGAAGNIGKRMTQRILKQGIDFIGIDYVENPELSDTTFEKQDVRDPAIADLIERRGVDSIIHLAFCTHPKLDPKTRDDIDINGSRNIADCAIKKGVKNIVFASSARVYGDQGSEGGFRDSEGNYLNPGEDFYAHNKIKAENIFLKAAQDHGLKVAILRLASVCWQGGGSGLGDMFKQTSKTGRFFLLGDKNSSLQLVHIDDVINACLNAIGREGIFDIAAEDKMTLVDIYTEVAKLGGKKPSSFRLPEKPVLWTVWVLWKLGISPIPPFFLKMFGYETSLNVSKTIPVLGKPRFSMLQILKDVVAG